MAKRKSQKMRGSRTYGYGSHKKHRGSGSKGGVGFSGSLKQKKTWIMKNDPKHTGADSFKSLQGRGLRKKIKAISLRDVERLSQEKEIVLKDFGYDKVLGTGQLTKPITIKAKVFSDKAKQKIEKAGGKALVEE